MFGYFNHFYEESLYFRAVGKTNIYNSFPFSWISMDTVLFKYVTQKWLTVLGKGTVLGFRF